MSRDELEVAALNLAVLGYACVPLGSGRKPILKGWPDFSADPEATRARFRAVRASGLAVVTRGFVVIDCDRNHASGADGVQAFADLVHANDGTLPQGPRVRTRRDGLHIWLSIPAYVVVRSSAGKVARGVDVKGARSCAVCPPTQGYAWLEPPLDIMPPMAPDWLLQLMASKPPAPRPKGQPGDYSGSFSRYGAAALARELAALYHAQTGARACALFAAAARLGALAAAGVLPEHGVRAALEDAARACGLVAEDGERAAFAHIERGLAVGRAQPRALPKRGPR